MSKVRKINEDIKVGDPARYFQIIKMVDTKVLKVKENGDLILDTRSMGLCKNVCVKKHRVTKI